MPHYVAFLRAINVPGRSLQMDELRSQLEPLGLDNVQTFLTSGNVLFESPLEDRAELERQISARLEEGLEMEVPAFVRTVAELREIVASEPFPNAGEEAVFYVTFLKEEPPAKLRKALEALSGSKDSFLVRGSEVYWLMHQRGNFGYSTAHLEKELEMPATRRKLTSLRRIVENRLEEEV